MCGRYILVNGKKIFATWETIRKLRRQGIPFTDLTPRYNISPTQLSPVIAVRNNELVAEDMRWWLIPHWSKDGKVAFSTFNAKSETLAESRLFAPYFKSSRCLIPADGFYEWKKVTVEKEVKGKSKKVEEKIPMCIRKKGDEAMFFAGLFSVWKDAQEEEHPTFTIITTTPNALMADIHNRMPVILNEKDYDKWLDRDNKDTAELQKLLTPYPADKMYAYKVSTFVSSGRNEGEECMRAIDDDIIEAKD